VLNRRKMLLLLLVSALFLAFASGCSLQAAVDQEAVPGGEGSESGKVGTEPVVVRLEGGDWGYPTPFAHYSRGPGSAKMRYIFDSLLERDEKENIPWLAERWEILDGGERYIFHLRPGVRWQDGKPLKELF